MEFHLESDYNLISNLQVQSPEDNRNVNRSITLPVPYTLAFLTEVGFK